MARQIRIYDTTLRDGTQGEGVSFSMEDKVRLAQRLDALGRPLHRGRLAGLEPEGPPVLPPDPRRPAQARAHGGLRCDPAARHLGRRRPEPPGSRRGAHSGGHDLREVVAVPRHARAPDDAAREPPHDRRLGGVPRPARRGGRLRRRALLRRLQARPRVRARDAPGGRARRARAASCSATPTAGASRRRWPRSCAIPAGTSGSPLGIHAHNDGECAVANSLAAVLEGAEHVQGTLERLRRAVRQRQPGVDHPEPHAEARARARSRSSTSASCATSRASPSSWRTARPGRASRSWATRRSPTRPACTCRRS